MAQRRKLKPRLGKNLPTTISQHLRSNSCTTACTAFISQIGKLRPREGSDLPKVTQRVGGSARSGWGHFRSLTDSRAPPRLRGDFQDTSSLGRGLKSKTLPHADRSPGHCQSAAKGEPPTPSGPCEARGGEVGGGWRRGSARRLTAEPARGNLLLTWRRAVALSDREAGQPPFSARGLFPLAASQGATQPDPPQRTTPPAALARPASAITRFPALGRSHTPPTALIGSLPHPPGASGHSIGLSGVPVK